MLAAGGPPLSDSPPLRCAEFHLTRFRQLEFLTFLNCIGNKLELNHLSEIKLEIKLAEFPKFEIELNSNYSRITFAQIKATLIQVQFMPKCRFILINMRIAKTFSQCLARF